ncbi:MAG: serine hydrolase [Firmicutes bacterium]|jgi:beta-lactamase class A|nr:serine hydrolase [Bacillota bacterium]
MSIDESIDDRILELASSAGGIFGIAAKDFSTGREILLNADRQFVAASIIKIPIMVEAFSQAEEGLIRLQAKVKLVDTDKVGGSGILKVLSQGIKIPVIDLIRLMIVISDNTASNILIDILGINRVNRTMQELGFAEIILRRKFMTLPQAVQTANSVTPQSITGLLEKIAKGQVVSGWACEEMVKIMKQQQYSDLIPALIPVSYDKEESLVGQTKNVEIAHKTGSVSGVRHDAAIVYAGSTNYVVTILTSDLPDTNHGEDAIRRISLEIYRYFTGTPRL